MADRTSFATATTHFVEGQDERYGYRRSGPTSGRPLVLLQRFRGTIDDWDPALLDALAAEREVIVFDSLGVGWSTGTVPSTVAGMVDAVLEFIDALELETVDLLGWSMGGFLALSVVLARPDLVRHLVLAAATPGPLHDAPAPELGRLADKQFYEDDEDLLFLLFPSTPDGHRAGRAALERIHAATPVPSTVSPQGIEAQAAALTSMAASAEITWTRLSTVTIPILVAAGAMDDLIDAAHAFAMVRHIPNATEVVYGDAAHAFLFQHANDFAWQVRQFLQ